VIALSLIVSDALCAPIVLGVNATANVHDVLGASITGIAPHVPPPVNAYSKSDAVALAIINGFFAPVLVTVAFLVTVRPTATVPNASDAVTDIDVVAVAVGIAVDVEVAVAVAVSVAVAVAVAAAVAAVVAPAAAIVLSNITNASARTVGVHETTFQSEA
jgi:hypothetical protein